MDKVKTSTKQKKYAESGSIPEGFQIYNPTEKLLNPDLIAKAIWECLRDNDPEGVLEVLRIHFETVNLVKSLKKQELARSTAYKAFKHKNPTIKTLAKMISCCEKAA